MLMGFDELDKRTRRRRLRPGGGSSGSKRPDMDARDGVPPALGTPVFPIDGSVCEEDVDANIPPGAGGPTPFPAELEAEEAVPAAAPLAEDIPPCADVTAAAPGVPEVAPAFPAAAAAISSSVWNTTSVG